MATSQPGEAVKVLAQLKGNERLAGFVAYNLGIALLQDGRPQDAIEQLDKAGQLPAGDPPALAIRDKSNLVLGTMLFESGNFERARQSLDRVHLEGPFSNQALLRAGWAEASGQQYDRALVPWTILVGREPTDTAVQEVILAVPHAYASLKLHGRAALLYGRALELFSNQIERVDASIRSIREGQFLNALMRFARCAGNLLPDGVDGVSRLPNRIAKLPRPRGPGVEVYCLEGQSRCLRRHQPVARTELRAAAAGSRRAVPSAGFADSPAPGAAQAPRRTPAGHPDRAAAGLSGDCRGANRWRTHRTHREAARQL